MPPNPFAHLTLNPALCSYLRGRSNAAERGQLETRWVEAMSGYVDFLVQKQHQKTEVASDP